MTNDIYDVIIVGGSYAGLSAAMSLGRSLRKVLVIDSGNPCNRKAPQAHNFLTHDGDIPGDIAAKGRRNVEKYTTVEFRNGTAVHAERRNALFEVTTEDGKVVAGKKLLFATGLKDNLPDIPGAAECWGISILHCPYCHGYEAANQKTGLIGNGELGYEVVRLISNWTKDLVLFTDGECTFTDEQKTKLRTLNIPIVETAIMEIVHEQGRLSEVVLKDGSRYALQALYLKPAFEQHSLIPQALGCKLDEHGLLVVDTFHRTNVDGVYAAGDNCTFGRSIAVAVSAGSVAGVFLNKEMIEEGW